MSTTKIPVAHASRHGLLLNMTTGKPTYSRTQVYKIMQLMDTNKLTDEHVDKWNRSIIELHTKVIHKTGDK